MQPIHDQRILGLHHITAVAAEPQRNLDFYTGTLGLRLIKLTVDFDEPHIYHFYFGDAHGHPGTILTFFPSPGIPRGRSGPGQATITSFSVPENAMGYWRERLHSAGVHVDGPNNRFDEEYLAFHDPDGLPIELVSQRGRQITAGWDGGDVPEEYAIGGIHSATLEFEHPERTAELLTQVMGLHEAEQSGGRTRYGFGHGSKGSVIDIAHRPGVAHGLKGAGTVHHIAFRVANDEALLAWRDYLVGLGHDLTPVMDRSYFHSIYFREPGGVLFEIATEGPGFTVDEPLEELGTHLMLPEQYESDRAKLVQALAPLKLPKVTRE